jgi:hypothetical protein
MLKNITQLLLVTGTALLLARSEGRKTFSTPEEARDALLQAAASGLDELRALFGPNSGEILRTGDDVQDQNVRAQFNKLAVEKAQLEPLELDPDHVTLLVGTVEWPFPIPLRRKDGLWFWDIDEGKTEIRRRTIGGNELKAMEVCRGYVEAQEMYAETDRNGNGVPEYARRIFSSEGKKDGLYWPGEDSPVAAAFARAVAEGYAPSTGAPRPFHGYYYKVLFGQGPDAPRGARDYDIKGLMIGGFALVAWPAEYGVSGIMTFIVSQDGVVYEKDLGPSTGAMAKAMTRFNPDKSWSPAPDDPLS